MSIVNRRNALLGWGVWTVMKSASKRKARKAVTTDGGAPKKKAGGVAVGALVAVTGALVFWRKKKSPGDPPV